MTSIPQDAIQRIRKVLGKPYLSLAFGSIPNKISVMTACSGSGIFELSAAALFKQIGAHFKRDFQALLLQSWLFVLSN